MARKTKNYALTLPDGDEFYDVDVFNKNFETLDKETGNKVERNKDIAAGTKAKISFDEKGLVTGGEDLTPDDIPNIHISKVEGRPPIVYIDGTPIYGSRFFDVDKNGNAILREDGSGDYLLTVLENGSVILRDVITQVTDNLDSESGTDALSANQGRVLGSWIGKLSDLLTNAKTSLVEALNEVAEKLSSHLKDQRIHTSVFFPDETPTGTNYIWYSPYNSGGSAEYGGIILEAVPFNGDEKKLHAEVETKDYTFDNTAVNGKNGSIAVEIS